MALIGKITTGETLGVKTFHVTVETLDGEVRHQKSFNRYLEEAINYAKGFDSKKIYIDGKLVIGESPIERAKVYLAEIENRENELRSIIKEFDEYLRISSFEEKYVLKEDIERRVRAMKDLMV